MMKVYTLSTCPWCKKLKQFLDEKQVDYISIDVDKASIDEKQQALKEIDNLVGRRSFPITVINNKAIQGFKPEKIEEALEENDR